jgi:hypothetical protein
LILVLQIVAIFWLNDITTGVAEDICSPNPCPIPSLIVNDGWIGAG